jgi:dTDP-4-amino-4,6-dideoxygalactose transaminase
VLLGGGIPVFADINPKTQNLSLDSFKRVVTSNTKAVIVVHYAGIASELHEIVAFAKSKDIIVVEDADHCLGSLLDGRELGTFGDFGCFSFHETKNITCGEGGALLINDQKYVSRLEVIREKGTDRSRFLRGQVDKYTWRDRGSSFLPSEISAAFLYAQLGDIDLVTKQRQESWNHYNDLLASSEEQGLLQRPGLPSQSSGNGHIYYVLLQNVEVRQYVISSLLRLGIQTTFHYIPLHNSPYGSKFKHDPLGVTVSEVNSDGLLRLPMWYGISPSDREIVVNSLTLVLKNMSSHRPESVT